MSKVLGVLGGMGPAATVDFLDRLVKATPARRDQDHVRVLVDSNPKVPDRNQAIAGTGPSAGPVLAQMARGLERAGAEVLVMACNTAHAFAADIKAAVTIPFIDMIEATAERISERCPPHARIGVLAVDGCLAAGLYQRALDARGFEAVLLSPPDQARFMAAIGAIKSGDLATARPEVVALARSFEGVAVVVAACTEIPLVLKPGDIDMPLIDSTDVLVARALAQVTA